MSALRPTTMAAEAGEEEFLAGGVPVEVDGHARLGLETLAQGDVEGEDANAALVDGAVIHSVLGLGLESEVGPEVAEAGLLGEILVGPTGIGRASLELGEGDEAGEGPVQGTVVFEAAVRGFGQGFGQDDDVLLPLDLGHVVGEDLMRRLEGLRTLVRSGELFVEWLDNVTADELTADSRGLRGAHI